MKRYFAVQCGDRTYTAIGDIHTTIDTVWASQKSWFMPGTVVTITDDAGNSKTFTA